MIKWFWLLVLFLAGCAVAITPEPNTVWEQGQWKNEPSVVALATGWGKSHLCTGLVLDNHTVLSAGHCTLHPSDTYIVYGCNDIKSSICQRLQVSAIYTHPEYKMSFDSGNDLALFKTVDTIQLPAVKLARKNHYKGDTIKAVGFGKRNEKSGILYFGYGTIKDEYRYEFSALLKKGMDPNPGDSGGPAFVFEDGQYRLLGILARVSLNKGKKKNEYHHSGIGIYTRVKPYQNWIDKSK